MNFMKLLPFTSLLPLLALSSCQLSSEKAKEEAARIDSIPPPSKLQVTDTSTSPQEELPDLSLAAKPDEEPKSEVNVIESGDFIFKDPLKDLPSQSDLDSPTAPLVPVPTKEDIESKASSPSGPPLVTNP